jgi:four helix bundle protein
MAASEKTGTGRGTGTGKDENGNGRTGAVAAGGSLGTEPSYFPHERLDVYRAALEFHRAMAAALPRRCSGDLRDQVARASTSVVLNIAEGAGRTSLPDKQRFYEIAKGSATECAATLDLLRFQPGGDAQARANARRLAVRIVQMLTRLSAGPR